MNKGAIFTPEQALIQGGQSSAVSAGYSDWQLFLVKRIDSVDGTEGCIPMICLPKNLIGKRVKVTIEEQL